MSTKSPSVVNGLSSREDFATALGVPNVLADYIPEDDLAAMLGKRPRTLQLWRAQRTGPNPTLIGKSIYYSREAVEEWLKSREMPMPRQRSR